MDELFQQAYIQYGFAGLSIILLSFIIWLVKQLLESNKQLVELIYKNNSVLARLIDTLNILEVDSKEIRKDVKGSKEDIIEKTNEFREEFRSRQKSLDTHVDGLKNEMLRRPCITK